MGLLDLPSELRYTIYTFWFTGKTYRSATRHRRLYGESWLSDAFTICKPIGHDPWLTHAILEKSTFRVKDTDDLNRLRARFGDAAIHPVSRIQLGPAMACDDALRHLQILMPRLNRIQIAGCLSPMWRVWDWRLEGFDMHHWARYVACLCLFAPGRVPGPCSLLAEQAFNGLVELIVEFVWHDPDFGQRRMCFSTADWVLAYEFRGKRYRIEQVRLEDLQGALEDSPFSGLG